MTMRITILTMACVATGMATPLHGQSLAQRIAAVRDGAVSFHYTARPEVCGDGEHFIRTGRSSYYGSWSEHRGMEPCRSGPAQVRLTLENGEVIRVQHWVGPLRDRVARDLGQVSAPEAARYMMSLAATGSGRASSKAIFPAVIADSAVVWPEILAVAKDDSRSRSTHKDAMFWLSRYAAAAVAGRPNEPFDEDNERESDDDAVKTNAVFVLSQLRNGEGIPDLIKVARSNNNARVRGQALFWLGQSGDSRALPLFESLLRS